MTSRVHFAEGAAPERPLVLYDGHCRFCKAQMKNLVALAAPGAFEPVDFQAAGALARTPGLTRAACMEEMKLVTPDGRVFGGMEAAVRAVATRPLLGALAWGYYLPGVRQALDAAYRRVAAQRYRIAGRETCESGACAVHQAREESGQARDPLADG